MTNTLHQLLDHGQSPWIDNITRDMLENGELQRLIDEGIVGLTSNPTIFQKAIAGSKLYEDQLRQLVREDKNVSDIFDGLILEDIRDAANTLRPVYDRTNGRDGFVSIEVLPSLAFDCEKTLAEARRLFNYLSLPNVFIKIPATDEGIPAIRQSIAEGININITLIFSIDIYRQVANAFIEGLEERARSGQPIDRVSSVASFFVSRVDTAVDKQLDQLIAQTDDEGRKQELRNLQGKAAIANAKMAYAAYQEIFSGPRWEALAAKGAKSQRCLWASTSTKNPNYRDVIYVEQLIGPDTFNTMPPATIKAFLDHGVVERTLDRDVDQARAELASLADAGISMEQVTDQLQQDGVRLFTDSFNELIDTISQKREEMLAATS